MRHTVLQACVILTFTSTSLAQSTELEDLVNNLGSASFPVRDKATKTLSELSTAASKLALRLESEKDPEIKRRLTGVIATIRHRNFEVFLDACDQRADLAALDLYLEKLLVNKSILERKHSERIVRFLRRYFEKVDDKDRTRIKWHEFAKRDVVAADRMDKDRHMPRQLLVIESALFEHGFANGVVIARRLDSQIGTGSFHNTLVLINNEFTRSVEASNMGLSYAIVFCDGDFDAAAIDNSIVISTGKIRKREPGGKSILIDGTSPEFLNLPLFSLASIGACAAPNARGLLEFGVVKADSPFGKAGVLAGDVIISTNNTPIRTSRALKQAVRRQVAEESVLRLKVYRGDQVLQLTILF